MTDTLDLERRLLTMHSHLEPNDQYAMHLKEAINALASQRQRLAWAQAVLDSVEEFLEDRQDVTDGADGPRPNAAMSLLREVKEVRAALARKPT